MSRAYVLGLLVTVYTVSMIDRQILGILGEPIRVELDLTDTQLGLLNGLAFAFFYAVAGVPIALLSDRFGRRLIIVASLTFWSAMTALSGLAQSFGALMLARIGVGVGEAGCSPSSHAILADLYPHEERARAIGIYGLGIPIGTLFGLAAGGWIATEFGWRMAFFLLGLPGLLLAAVVFRTLPEPVRTVGAPGVQTSPAPPFRDSLRHLLALPTFRHLLVGGAVVTAVSGAMVVWAAPFLIRTHGFSLQEAGLAIGLIAGLPGAAGMYLGGALADRAGARDDRWRLWIVSASLLVACPFAICAWYMSSGLWTLALMSIPFVLCNFFYQATTFAQVQSISPVKMRATAAAILLFAMNLIGQGGGPQIVGVLSDRLKPALGIESLGTALSISALGLLWAAWHYWRAGISLEADIMAAGEVDELVAEH